jgi:hypothetical protein
MNTNGIKNPDLRNRRKLLPERNSAIHHPAVLTLPPEGGSNAEEGSLLD